jgi:hypothetical protein
VRRTDQNGALSRPTERQRAETARVTEALAKPVAFDFHDLPLRKVLTALEGLTSESFVLQPSARHAGTVKPETLVTGKGDGPLADSLRALLAPSGLTYLVRDEAVVIVPKP